MSVTFLFRPPRSGADEERRIIELQFDDAPVRIGRAPSCELCLPHPTVSELHAIAKPAEGGGWELVEQASRNGTWVNGSRLAPKATRALRDGDQVRIGAVWFQARVTAAPVVMRNTRDLALEIVSRFLGTQVASVLIVEGPDRGERLALAQEDRQYTIGRSSQCDLPLVDLGTSREHLRVVRRGDEVLLCERGAKNGVLLGDKRIGSGEVVRWPPSLDVRLGDTVLALEMPATFEAVTESVIAEQATEAAAPPSPTPVEAHAEMPARTEQASPQVAAAANALAPDAPARFQAEGVPPAAVPVLFAPTAQPPLGKRRLEIASVVAVVVIAVLALVACLWLLLA